MNIQEGNPLVNFTSLTDDEIYDKIKDLNNKLQHAMSYSQRDMIASINSLLDALYIEKENRNEKSMQDDMKKALTKLKKTENDPINFGDLSND